jgi:5'-3' exoribonuclease 1
MGIPSYFSYIIKNHTNIIRKRHQLKNKFTSLYMDCNSIIYDCIRKIENDTEPKPNGFNIEDSIITAVIAKIENYIDSIQPSNIIYIAFDGVAPFAKMEQQRTRRYKTGYLSSSYGKPESSPKPAFNTSSITPGTTFMNMLSLRVSRAFTNSDRFFGAKTVVVSGSDEPGEGEHKMFQHFRDSKMENETVAVYGLDADLIMLSIFHCFSCDNIFIFRESPEFGKALLGDSFARDELLYLDHRALSRAVLIEMGVTTDSKESIGRIYDYIFACFLLGNDFLPHFPALNIRTHGNYTMLETYRKLFSSSPDKRFISLETGNIQWRWVKLFLQELAKEEPNMILNEYTSRNKMENRYYPTTTKEECGIAFDNIPTIYRAEEHYVNPIENGWQTRYYRVAFHLDSSEVNKSFIDKLCNNYLEGLEWTFKYYTEGCSHWRWKYNYHYPPLFADLVERVPNFETVFIDETKGINKPFHPNTQLAYVIPKWNHPQLLSESVQTYLQENDYSKYYVEMNELKFQWMFCRYFWESHAILPNINLDVIEELDKMCMSEKKKRTTKSKRK